MYIPPEFIYVLVALGIGWLLYRYFSGHGGIQILRGDYAGLPDEGRVEVRHHVVRWKRAEGDSFVVMWQLESGHVISMRVIFDEADPDEPDVGHVDLRVDRRDETKGAAWTEKIKDRALRADAEAILHVLMREAKTARSDRTRVAAAKQVGDDRQP